jgi:hypothetical protein
MMFTKRDRRNRQLAKYGLRILQALSLPITGGQLFCE